jgi:hypothetical protein
LDFVVTASWLGCEVVSNVYEPAAYLKRALGVVRVTFWAQRLLDLLDNIRRRPGERVPTSCQHCIYTLDGEVTADTTAADLLPIGSDSMQNFRQVS